MLDNLAQAYGSSVNFEGESYRLLPHPGDLANTSREELASCKTGFRSKYILCASGAFASEDGPGLMRTLSYADARKRLMEIPGVGPKIADCVLLFSLDNMEAFPVDVWIRRIMQEHYVGRRATDEMIREYAREYFGRYAGYAQEYLYYYARKMKT